MRHNSQMSWARSCDQVAVTKLLVAEQHEEIMTIISINFVWPKQKQMRCYHILSDNVSMNFVWPKQE